MHPVSRCSNPLDRTLPDVFETDWMKNPQPFSHRVYQLAVEYLKRNPRAVSWIPDRPLALYDFLARRRVENGLRLLSQAKVVVTDRLHGHILSLLLGIPHVVLANTNGKVRSLYDTWTRECTFTRWADSLSEALDTARALADERAT